ncbi:YicC/YloC family endoribonuclease [Brevundimonas sp. 2R-24]|uniref:YicC/YloC family endoribonuclease n=1 Tax=Peiella sedimenti TaxID=3061083 RepID=A0ABT8SIF6_9CAUL|nr:YicC/YloC family endoribonuclease [Caulobacteraceae bacterium XZ-24]
MTGFARVEGGEAGYTWVVEARSVNGRTLEVRFRLPPGHDALEGPAREAAQKALRRGQATISVQLARPASAADLRINQEVLDHWMEAARSLEAKGAGAARADGLLGLKGVIDSAEADEGDREALHAALLGDIGLAVERLAEARRAEGAALKPVLEGFIDRIAALRADAEAEADAQVAAVRERFTRRVSELAGAAAPEMEERIFQEAAVLAARADVREELDRLAAHLDAARTLVTEGQGVGRKLDFLMQEFMREANTLCSKSASTALTAIGLELKAVIEQLREQIQNVE